MFCVLDQFDQVSFWILHMTLMASQASQASHAQPPSHTSTMPMYRTVNTALTMVEAMIHNTRNAAEAMEPTLGIHGS